MKAHSGKSAQADESRNAALGCSKYWSLLLSTLINCRQTRFLTAEQKKMFSAWDTSCLSRLLLCNKWPQTQQLTTAGYLMLCGSGVQAWLSRFRFSASGSHQAAINVLAGPHSHLKVQLGGDHAQVHSGYWHHWIPCGYRTAFLVTWAPSQHVCLLLLGQQEGKSDSH